MAVLWPSVSTVPPTTRLQDPAPCWSAFALGGLLTSAVDWAKEPRWTVLSVEITEFTTLDPANGAYFTTGDSALSVVHCAQAPFVPAKIVTAATAAHRTAFAILNCCPRDMRWTLPVIVGRIRPIPFSPKKLAQYICCSDTMNRVWLSTWAGRQKARSSLSAPSFPKTAAPSQQVLRVWSAVGPRRQSKRCSRNQPPDACPAAPQAAFLCAAPSISAPRCVDPASPA